ncbi:TIGR03089 family protein [Corynebacterium sp. L4756]|uniref:TIGR03089 family protein n=1 Tax=unclassified Corynebacterium TaxID=2624378 RepID=UPI00374DDB50
MDLLNHLLTSDAATPRLTVYNESTGARMDFSAQTLENWVSKIANMLGEELELDEDSTLLIDLPVTWQAAVIALSSLAAGSSFEFINSATVDANLTDSGEEALTADAVFTSTDKFELYSAGNIAVASDGSSPDIVLVTDDPFGRGVVESGRSLPAGAVDFGPTVRFYGDDYFGHTTPLPELYPDAGNPERLLSTGWHDNDTFTQSVIHPLAAGGSAVIVAGLSTAERLEHIANNENTTARL